MTESLDSTKRLLLRMSIRELEDELRNIADLQRRRTPNMKELAYENLVETILNKKKEEEYLNKLRRRL